MSKDQTKPIEKKKPRTVSPEIKAMNRIEAILEELDPSTAERVARYAYEKARQRDSERMKDILQDANSFGPMQVIPHRSSVNV